MEHQQGRRSSGTEMRLSDHFDSDEFRCSCQRQECDAPTLPDARLIALLEIWRGRLHNSPLVVTSGVRCEYWNRFVGGAKDSAHVKGKAADIKCTDSVARFRMLRTLFQPDQLFERIGIGREFIHVDVDNRDAAAAWHYYTQKG